MTSHHICFVLSLGFAVMLLISCGSDDASTSTMSDNAATGDASNTSNTSNSEMVTTMTDSDTSQNSTSDEMIPTEFSASMCGGFFPQPAGVLSLAEACAECIDESCCDEAKACADDATCIGFRLCLDEDECVNTPGCYDSCLEENNVLFNEANQAFLSCRNRNCGEPCQRFIDWSCVGAPSPPQEVEPGDYEITITIRDLQSTRPVEGAIIKACAKDDVMCEDPLATQTTDAGGVAALTVPQSASGFEGYLDIQEGGVFPAIGMFPAPLIGDKAISFDLLGVNTAALFAAIISLELNPDRGHVAGTSVECAGRAANGVSLSTDYPEDGTTTAYIKGANPSAEATETDASGIGAVFNLPPGQWTLTGTRAEDGTTLYVRPFFTRAGFLTQFSELPPNQ